MKVINLFSGPGVGKSTCAAHLFYLMKTNEYKVELVTEYAKDMVYENRDNILSDQLYVFAKQNRRLKRLEGHVDWIITDSPLLLSTIYNKDLLELNTLVYKMFSSYNNYNFFLNRKKAYQSYGRKQTEIEAKGIDNRVLDMLKNVGVDFYQIDSIPNCAKEILRIIENESLS